MVLRSVVAAANGTSNPLPPIASEGAAALASASATQVAAPFGVLMSVSNPLLETDPQAPLDSVAAFELLTALRRGSGRSKTLASAFVPTTGQMPSAATAVISRTPIPAASPGRTAGEWSNTSAFAALKDDGSVVTWGGATGGYSDRVATKLSSGVVQIYSSQGAFAALKSDGSVVTWGSSSSGGDSSAVADKLTGGVTRIFSTQQAFAALKSDGTVVTWGDSSRGGNSDSVVNQLRDVRTIYSTDSAFAALRSDNSVVTWGDANYGGSTRFLAYSGWVDVAPQVSSGVSQIFSNYSAFAALKTDGSVVTWGWAASGGDSSVFAAALSSGVKEIASSRTGFTALKNSGSAVSWGNSGLESPSGDYEMQVSASLGGGVTRVVAADYAYAALKSDGSVVVWGDPEKGGRPEVYYDLWTHSSIASRLSSGVTAIYASFGAFAAVKADGSVVTWGSDDHGGDSSKVSGKLSSGVVKIVSMNSDGGSGFAALKSDGSVATWGLFTGTPPDAAKLGSGVTQIVSNIGAFAALKDDGSVVTWGSFSTGGGESIPGGVVSFADPFNEDRLASAVSVPVVSISPASVGVLEGKSGSSNAVFTVSLSKAAAAPVTVQWATANGSATAGSDFTVGSGTLTFAPGVTSQTVNVAVAGDTTVESDETFTVTLSSPSGATLGTATAIGTIKNDDTATSEPTLSIANATVTEGNLGQKTLAFTVSLSSAPASQVMVAYQTAAGTATSGQDFLPAADLLTFAPGVISQTVNISVIGDTAVESDETFTVTLSGPVGATLGTASATGTITNDDGAKTVPTITIDDISSVPEGNSGYSTANFTVTLSAASTTPVTVQYVTGTSSVYPSTAGVDYVAITTPKTLTFNPGETKKLASVSVIGDTTVESNERFTVTLSNPSGATIARGTANATITDDDTAVSPPAVSIANVSVLESNSGTANAVFTVSLSKAAASPVTVKYATSNGSASAGSDYTASSGTLTFAAGVTSQTVNVAVTGDTAVEADETFTMTLSAPSGATLGTLSKATGTIRNDDVAVAPPVVSLSPGSVNVLEANSGVSKATFTVALANGSTAASDVTVNYATANGTATAGSDYTAVSAGSVKILKGTSSATFTVDVAGDTAVESDETFTVTLTSATGASLGTAKAATGTIRNDDVTVAPPVVSIGNVSVLEGNSGTATAAFTVSLSKAAASPVTVKYATANGTATAGSDYTAGSGTVTFAAGVTSQTVNIGVIGDAAVESDETFTVTLSGPSGATLGTATATGTIRNDDVASGSITRTPIAATYAGNTRYERRNGTGFAALKSDGSVISWGNPGVGGYPNFAAVADQLRSGVVQIYSSGAAFAALKSDGSVVTWGEPSSGGLREVIQYGQTSGVSIAAKLSSGVVGIASSGRAFAALKSDGSVVAWGLSSQGGDLSRVASQLTSGVVRVFSNNSAFAALKNDGSVVAWSNPQDLGGSLFDPGDTSGVASQLTGVTNIFSTERAFAALKSDGSVVAWGYYYGGGDVSRGATGKLGSGVVSISSTREAFAALKSDGSIVTWGNPYAGGDSSDVGATLAAGGFTQVYSTDSAFAALKSDGSVVTWGKVDPSKIVVTDGGGDSSAVASKLRSGVTLISSTRLAFAALKSDGSVVTWGADGSGGNSSSVANQLLGGVTKIFSNDYAFAALKGDGSVVTWGDMGEGGDSSSVADKLRSGVTQIYSTSGAFAALKNDGSVVVWGDSYYGADASGVADKLRSGVVSFADPLNDDRLRY